jgi:hypothetical protein
VVGGYEVRRRLSSNAIVPSAIMPAAPAMVTPDVDPVTGRPFGTDVDGAVVLGRATEVVVVVPPTDVGIEVVVPAATEVVVGAVVVVVGAVVVVVVVVSGGHEMAVVSVANAPAVNGTVNWL